jgi:hypothetical protein
MGQYIQDGNDLNYGIHVLSLTAWFLEGASYVVCKKTPGKFVYWDRERWVDTIFEAYLSINEPKAKNIAYDLYQRGEFKVGGLQLCPLSYGMSPCCIKDVLSGEWLTVDGGWTTDIYQCKMIQGPEAGVEIMVLLRGQKNEG